MRSIFTTWAFGSADLPAVFKVEADWVLWVSLVSLLAAMFVKLKGRKIEEKLSGDFQARFVVVVFYLEVA